MKFYKKTKSHQALFIQNGEAKNSRWLKKNNKTENELIMNAKFGLRFII